MFAEPASPEVPTTFIAATALTTARTVVTHDKRARFDDLPGVRVRQL
ncbi:hypothetical protein [Streptomyces sp. MBT33]|nr:hypothetical protein [Streptomyces sp. MBT33]